MQWLQSLWNRIFVRRGDYWEPSVGPGLGSLTESSVNIFVNDSAPEAKYAHLIVRREGKEVWRGTRALNQNFLGSAIFVLDGLEPAVHEYKVFISEFAGNMGWLKGEVRTFDLSSSEASWNVVLGSCRYILRLAGIDVWDSRSDKAFRSMARINKTDTPIEAAFFVGDQIYADDLNDLKNDTTLQQFADRYRAAMSTPHFKEFFSQVPFINTLDDHEIEDNYPAKANKIKMLTKVPAALHTYETFQLSYSELFNVEGGKIVGRPNRYWYDATSPNGMVDYFVTDMRTERNEEEELVVGEEQFDSLLSWLHNSSGAVYKVIVGPVPLVPKGLPSGNVFDDENDKWWYSYEQTSKLLSSIWTLDKRVQPVMFAGDIHMSCVAQAKHRTGRNFVNVISSPIFWPYPNAPGKFDTDPKTYKASKVTLSAPVTEDNFAFVQFNEKFMNISFMPRKSRSISDDAIYTQKVYHHNSVRPQRRRRRSG